MPVPEGRGDVPRDALPLAHRVLSGLRARLSRSGRVRDRPGVPHGPDALVPLHPHAAIGPDAPMVVERQVQLRDGRAGGDSRGPHDVAGGDRAAVRQPHARIVDRLQAGARADLHALALDLPHRKGRQVLRHLVHYPVAASTRIQRILRRAQRG
jgi:hypothetical protein